MLYYYSARFFEDVLVTGYIDTSGDLVLYASNMVVPSSPALQGATIVVGTWSWGAGLLSNWTTPVPTIPAHASARVCSIPLSSVTAQCGSLSECVLTLNMYGPAAAGETPGLPLAHNWVFVAPLRNVTTMRNPGLHITDVVEAPRSVFGYDAFYVVVTADALPAAIVWLETALPGRFSENGLLLTSHVLNVTWTSLEPGVTAAQLASSLLVHSLWDVASYGA